MPLTAEQIVRRGRRHRQGMFEALDASLPTYSVPIATESNAPGWLFCHEYITTIPDVLYPADPEIVRLIREYAPEMQPVTIRSVWQRSWAEGREEMVTVRHGIARAVEDPVLPTHVFDCEYPSAPVLGMRTLHPNYLDFSWYASDVRPYGYDLPGEFLPFDYQLFYAMEKGRTQYLSAAEQAQAFIKPKRDAHEMNKRRRERNDKEIDAEINSRISKALATASDAEITDYLIGSPENPASPVSKGA